MEAELVGTQFGVVLEESRGQREQLAEALDAGEAATNDGHRQQPAPHRAGWQHSSPSNAISSRSRIATASSTCLSPIASSAIPGVGKVLVTAPAVMTMASYGSCCSGPSAGRTVARPVRVVDVDDADASSARSFFPSFQAL
jgi:hypothetical protein